MARSFEVATRPIDLEEAEEGWVMVIREVTHEREIQQRAQQQERLAAVGQLAAGIAHDFNNIMAVIVLYAQLSLRAVDLPDKLRDRLETMERQARRATELIEQILDFGRRSVLERQPMDLAPFMKEQVKMLERTLPESIEIELRLVGRPAEYRVSADPTRIQQVVMNLAVNARDAMEPVGGGKLQIGLERTRLNSDNEIGAEAGDWVVATVSDTGAGISPKIQAHIFEPFFTTKGPGEGSGLGLAQVYGIVKQHHGHIEVSSWPGKGTTFTFYLPALPVVQPEAEAPGELPLQHGQNELILVVEDDEIVRGALVSGLGMMNYRIIEAGNGRQALEILAERSDEIALVLSDLVMPELGGRELLKHLAESGPPCKVILMTGYPLGEEVIELSDQGMFDWFRKPVDLNRLAQVVYEALHDE
jgi:signal transduction histidine kinase/ActR/RegA family two-component response regulator